MQVGHGSRTVLLCILCALAGSWLLTKEFRSGTGVDYRKDARRSTAATAAPVALAYSARSRSYEERLRETQNIDWKDVAARAQRAAVLIEWLSADRGGALQFIMRVGSKDIWLPGVTKAIGEKATSSELLAIANGAEDPGNAVYQVGRWAMPEVVNGLANLMPSVGIAAAGPTAGAIGGLLAVLNVDRAVAFAKEQASDQVRAFAFSGIFGELTSTPNGGTTIRSMYAALPPSIQTDDSVLFSYGNAIWGSDPAGALQALESISSPKQRMVALISLSRAAASASPETAIAAIYASGVSDQGVYNHVSRILQNWSAVDPQAATNFLSTTQIIPSADMPKYTPIVVPPGGGKG